MHERLKPELEAAIWGYPNTSGITPLDLLALVLPDPVEEVTKGGIILPDAAQEREKYNTQKATLIALGKSCHVQWVEKPQPGDRILIAQYAGKMVKGDDGQDYRIVKEDDIIAMLEK
jgi:chaperonin GroES